MRTMFKTAALAAVLIMAGAYAFLALRGPHGLAALRERQRQIRELQEQNANLEQEIALKRERIGKLRESRGEQALEIRRRLKLLKNKETTFIIQDQAQQ